MVTNSRAWSCSWVVSKRQQYFQHIYMRMRVCISTALLILLLNFNLYIYTHITLTHAQICMCKSWSRFSKRWYLVRDLALVFERPEPVVFHLANGPVPLSQRQNHLTTLLFRPCNWVAREAAVIIIHLQWRKMSYRIFVIYQTVLNVSVEGNNLIFSNVNSGKLDLCFFILVGKYKMPWELKLKC